MSCHNPLEFEKTHAGQGWRVWKAMPDLLWNNKFNANTRFAILGGDQVYTDPKHDELRFSTSDDERRALLIGLYRQFWSDPAYQNVMRNLPAFMMWDDHDIYDGWGSFDINTHSEGGKVDWNGIYSSAKERSPRSRRLESRSNTPWRQFLLYLCARQHRFHSSRPKDESNVFTSADLVSLPTR